MLKSTFLRLVEIEDEDHGKNLRKGQFFLMGSKVCAQKEEKKVGNEISYYQVVEKTERGMEYAPVYDILEKDKGE